MTDISEQLQQERRDEQIADRHERMAELHTPSPEKPREGDTQPGDPSARPHFIEQRLRGMAKLDGEIRGLQQEYLPQNPLAPQAIPDPQARFSEYFGDMTPEIANHVLVALANINMASNRIYKALDTPYRVIGNFNGAGELVDLTLCPDRDPSREEFVKEGFRRVFEEGQRTHK